MPRKGFLKELDDTRIGAWVGSLRGRNEFDETLEEILDPGRKHVRRLDDDELAEVLAREPDSKLGRLAASELRSRESWRGPRKWSLVISGLAFVLSMLAFVRTL